jgi:cyclopropane fatty-acyl-phospholipid synthase-like methyltransferase
MDGIAPTGAWLTEVDFHLHDDVLAIELGKFFKGKSVMDFGCGMGFYVRLLRFLGVECDGCDGNPNTAKLTLNQCCVRDLAEPFDLGRRYDWALSLEVGEHIPQWFEATFLANLCRHNREGIVLSWAVPGQGGRGHVNERDNDYIKRSLGSRGYENDLNAEFGLRSQSYLPWFKNTIMVFRKRQS